MKSYYKEQCAAGGDWLCLPFANKDALDGLFEVEGIPSFIIVSPEGKVINENGRGLVPDGKASDFPWTPPAIADMNSAAVNKINEIPAMCIFLESCTPELQEQIIATLTPIAAEYAAQDEPELIFLAAKSSGDVSPQIRSMTGLPSPGQSFKQEKSADVSPTEVPPALVRSISATQPSLVLMDIPDNGGYYVGQMSAALDGNGVKAMIAALDGNGV